MSLRDRLPSVLRSPLDVRVDHAFEGPEDDPYLGAVETPLGNLLVVSQETAEGYHEDGYMETREFMAADADVVVSLSEVR
ncbi:hypothetical protein ACFQJC_04820 [Haloferax namakaokahaiae]|uniref:Uncharacterized protein n=1 Tax=Haloferax namakaokahaiae TaxID=1748331 RepID=A0ABD5ZCV3_9EURY